MERVGAVIGEEWRVRQAASTAVASDLEGAAKATTKEDLIKLTGSGQASRIAGIHDGLRRRRQRGDSDLAGGEPRIGDGGSPAGIAYRGETDLDSTPLYGGRARRRRTLSGGFRGSSRAEQNGEKVKRTSEARGKGRVRKRD